MEIYCERDKKRKQMLLLFGEPRGGFFHSPFAFCEENYDFANIIKDRVRHFGECCHKSETINLQG